MQMKYLIAALTHCAINENEAKMAILVSRFNANSFYQAQVGTSFSLLSLSLCLSLCLCFYTPFTSLLC